MHFLRADPIVARQPRNGEGCSRGSTLGTEGRDVIEGQSREASPPGMSQIISSKRMTDHTFMHKQEVLMHPNACRMLQSHCLRTWPLLVQDASAESASKAQARESELQAQLDAVSKELAGAQADAAQQRASCSDSEGVRAQVSVMCVHQKVFFCTLYARDMSD